MESMDDLEQRARNLDDPEALAIVLVAKILAVELKPGGNYLVLLDEQTWNRSLAEGLCRLMYKRFGMELTTVLLPMKDGKFGIQFVDPDKREVQ